LKSWSQDTTRSAAQTDSVRISLGDTVRIDSAGRRSTSGIDTIVVISAKDTVHFRVRQKLMHLRGTADVKYKQQRIEAEVVDMDFNSSMMTAEGAPDSTGTIIGFPVFTDGPEQFAGESMTYNFKTGRGRVTFGETEVEGGYYFGSRIKRVTENIAYVEHGCFTTCDAPEPHFYFNSPEMKVVMNDKIYLDPVIWYVEDIPVFALPFGLFFSTERGRRSGLIMPSPLLTNDRGVVLQNLGYYFAVSDYFDTEITTDLTTKGGFTLYNRSQWAVRGVMNGNAELRFGYTRFNVLDPYTMNLGLQVSHQQQFRPNESISANLLFTTDRLFQNTSLNPLDRVRQNARSTASYQRTFYNGMTLNANYVRDQNMINGSVTQTPAVSFGVPQFYPLRKFIDGSSWLRDLTLVYRVTGRYSHSSTRNTDTAAFAVKENTVIEHRPGITVTPKLGNVTLQPTVTYSENWYAQRYTQNVNPIDSTIVTSRETGFFREYTYRFGVSASTFLYGMAYPRAFGVSAFRHTLQPVIGLQYAPDQSDPSLGFFGQYVSPVTGKTVSYHRFGDAGRLANTSEQFMVTLGLLNKFSIKPMQAIDDTVPARPIDLLTFNLNTSYNLAADSVRLAPITFNVRTPVLDIIEFNLSGAFDVYEQAKVADDATGVLTWRKLATTALEAGQWLGRFTNVSVQLGTRFSSSGVSFAQRTIDGDTTSADTTRDDLRSRFSRRLNVREEQTDLFADNSPGWSSIIMPWDASVNLNYSVNSPTPEVTTESLLLSFRGSVSLTETLRVNVLGTLDVLTGTINSPIIDITKQIHCWNLTLNWVPTGFNQGFFLRFSAAAPQLRGLEFPKQSTPLYR
jgi:hypothetical protein